MYSTGRADVVQLRDKNNAVVANYQYDAWGKLRYVYDNAGAEITDASHIALINPLFATGAIITIAGPASIAFRARIRRFINVDGNVSTGQGLLSNILN